MFDLTGRVALVTGGNGGIGLGMARGLARAGAAVAIAGRDADKSAAAARELSALGARVATLAADVTDTAAVARMVADTLDAFGRIDCLVVNAGVNERKAPQDYTAEEWDWIIETNLTAPFHCARAVYPAMKAGGGGKIVTVGSMASLFGLAFAAPYASSKGGIVQLTRSLAVAWAPDNIQVNAVLPGWIDTPLTRRARTQVEGLNEKVVNRTPARRWGAPEDFEGIAAFLASPASDYVTGAAIPVDGGYSVNGL